MSFRRILFIPSADSLEQPSARRLLQLAGPDTEIEVFEPVFDPFLDRDLAGDPRDFDRLRDEIVRKRLGKAEALAEALRAKRLRATAAAAWDHPLYEAVVRRVARIHADLVISEPLAGRAGALSNADWRLVAACPAAVLLVMSDGSSAYGDIVAAVDPFHAHAKPVDLDPAILEAALAVSTRTGANLTAVHCFLPLTKALSGSAFENLPVDDAEARLETFRRQRLEELGAGLGLERGRARLLRGRAADTLLDLAEQGAADLIVMGALSRGRVQDLVIGSTAERVLHRAQVDVMVVKPPGFESHISAIVHDDLPVAPIYYPP